VITTDDVALKTGVETMNFNTRLIEQIDFNTRLVEDEYEE